MANDHHERIRTILNELVGLDSSAVESRLVGLEAHEPTVAAEVRSLLHGRSQPSNVDAEGRSQGTRSWCDGDQADHDSSVHLSESSTLSRAPEIPTSDLPSLDPLDSLREFVNSSQHPTKNLQPESDPQSDDTLPLRLGRYEVEELLGQGGFGSVWKALDPLLGRPVAIKVPRPGRVLSADRAKAFLDEATKLARLPHPNIVRVLDVGQDGIYWFIVSEFIDGGTLSNHLEALGADHPRAVRVLISIAEALHHAHLRGYVHRDVKPGNILMDSHGTPYLADFGLAVTEWDQLGESPALMGTVEYMSPEQADFGNREVDARSDIFSLGVVFYKLLTGRLPYLARDRRDYLDQVLRREPRSPRTIDDTIPPELATICLRCLAKAPDQRFQSALDLANALRDWLHTLTVPVPVPRKRTWAWVLGSLGVVAMVTLVVVLAWKDPSDAPSVSQTPPPVIVPSPTARQEVEVPREVFPDPLGWGELLGGPPKELSCPGQGDTGTWGWDDKHQSLLLSSRGLNFVRLGELDQGTHDVAIDIERPDWEGGTGLFFGFRVVEDQGVIRAHTEMFRLILTQNLQRQWILKLERRLTSIDPKSGSLFGTNVSAIVPRPPPDGRGRLGVRVEDGKVTRVTWFDQKILELTSPRDRHRFESEDATGDWGVFTQLGASSFSHLHYQKGRP